MKTHRRRVAVCTALFLVLAEVPIALAGETLVDALKQRYPLSRIEVQNPAIQGTVARQGARLRLQADALPAKAFRVTQVNTKSPRFHVRDYARVELVSGRPVTIEPGELTLPKGTELVVLDAKVEGDAVRLFTHTREPVSRTGGRPVYGCTEFVFRFDGGRLGLADATRVERAIEQWLTSAS